MCPPQDLIKPVRMGISSLKLGGVETANMVLDGLFRREPRDTEARPLYEKVVAQARQVGFFRDCGVPDTLDGRFESIALHAFLVLHRLKADHPETAGLAQALFDVMFRDMDQSLRELGVGDLGVGPRVKRMAEGLYGRIAAYEAGLEGPAGELEAALRRNLYGTVSPEPAQLQAMAGYLRREAASLAERDLTAIEAGGPGFGPPPAVSNQ